MIVNSGPALEMSVDFARSPAEIAACNELIAQTYLDEYGVVLTSDSSVDPDGGVERLPDRLLMGHVGDQLVASSGLYVEDTYVGAYGRIPPGDIQQMLHEAGVDADAPRTMIELTKAVVRKDFKKRGLGRLLLGVSHARTFLDAGEDPPLLVLCGKVSILRLWRVLGIRTRRIRPFPVYRNHARYRAPGDPVESHLVIPELDIHPRWYGLTVPSTVAVDYFGVHHAR